MKRPESKPESKRGRKPETKIDWTIAVDDQEWHAALGAPQTVPSPQSLRQKEIGLAGVAAFALLLLLGGLLWQTYQPGAREKRPHTSSAAQIEQPLTHTLEMLDGAMQVKSLQRYGDQVMAQVLVSYPEEGLSHSYRQTRFYEDRGQGWQRIDLAPGFSGPVKILQLTNFSIRYYPFDADAVFAAAPKLNRLYETLRQDLGLSATAAPYYIIDMTAADQARTASDYVFSQRTISIFSPNLMAAPIETSPATLLYQQTLYPLSRMLLVAAIDPHDTLWKSRFTHWSSLVDAFILWEVWDASGPSASERELVVRWLYHNRRSPETRQPLPAKYASLCRNYALRRNAPVELSIPFTCTEVDKYASTAWKYLVPLTTLQEWNKPGDRETIRERTLAAPVTGETMLEYIVAVYGRDKLPAFMDALGNYTDLDTLIPALFDVSLQDFEAGWQSYLIQHYN